MIHAASLVVHSMHFPFLSDPEMNITKGLSTTSQASGMYMHKEWNAKYSSCMQCNPPLMLQSLIVVALLTDSGHLTTEY